MATETQEVLIKIQVEADQAVKRQQELKTALDGAKIALKELETAEGKTSAAYIAQEATIKQLNTQIAANQRVLTQMASTTTEAAGAYAALNQKSAEANQRAKDLAAAYGANDQRTKEAQATALGYTNQLKEIDKAIGQNQRSVGDYQIATKGLGVVYEDLQKKSDAFKTGFMNIGNSISGMKSPLDLFKKGVDSTGLSMEMLSKNPIMAMLTILIGLFNAVKDSIGSSSKATNTLKEAMAPVNAIMTVTKNITVAIVQVFLDAFLAVSKFTTAIYAFVSGNDKYTQSVKDAMKVEKERQLISKMNRELIVEEAKGNLDVAKLRDKVTEKDKYSRQQREQFLREAIAIEKQMSAEKVKIATMEYNNLVKQLRSKAELNGDEKKQLADAQAKMYNVQTDYYSAVRRMKTQAATFNKQEDDAALQAQQQASEQAAAAREKAAKTREKAEADRRAAREKANKEELDRLKNNADEAIKILDYEVQMSKLKADEKNAAVKLSDQQAHAQKLADIDAQNAVELEKQTVLFGMKQITEQQFNAAVKLANQEKNTAIAQENAAFDEAQRQLKNEAALIDFQNKYDTAVLNNENMAALEAEQLENKYQAEILAAEKTGADTTLIDAKYSAMKQDLAKKELDAKLSLASDFAGNVATIFGKNTKVGKAAASAQIAIDTYKGAMAAFASMQGIPFVGPALGVAAAAAVAVQGAKSIKDVWAVKSGLPGDGGGGGTTSVNAAVTAPATNVTGSLVSRTSSETNQQSQQTAVSNALQANPTTPVLVVDNVTDAQANKANVKVANSL